jgi:hypothetical protein
VASVIVAHDSQCPALCQGGRTSFEPYCGHFTDHCCACHAQAALEELVEAADVMGVPVAAGWRTEAFKRLNAALRPFRKDVAP